MAALADLPLIASGKVRDIYELGGRILMVASDRISTYDAVHPTPIPGKGQVLTGMSVFWFELTSAIVPNHLISATEEVPAQVRGRALVVARLEMLPVECVVRGYLSGSGWSDYQRGGTVGGIALPGGLRESERLPEPLFTPATKAALGDHDENIDFEGAVAAIGDRGLAERVRVASIAVYERAAEHARGRGIILASTCCWRSLRAGSSATTPTGSRRSTRRTPGRRGPRCASCSRPTRAPAGWTSTRSSTTRRSRATPRSWSAAGRDRVGTPRQPRCQCS